MALISRLRVRTPPLLLPVVVGLLGAWLGMAAWGSAAVSMGPFRVQLGAGFGRGVTEIGLPPFGHLTADTHLAPLRLTATLVDISIPQLTRDVARQGVDEVARRVQRDANSRLGPYFLRLVGVALAGTALVSLLVFRSRWRQILAALKRAEVDRVPDRLAHHFIAEHTAELLDLVSPRS